MTAQQFEIRFDGDVPGLAEHKLDLNAFGKSLNALSEVVRNAVAEQIRRTTSCTARSANEQARQIPLYLLGVEQGSALPMFELPLTESHQFDVDDVVSTVASWLQEGYEGRSRKNSVVNFYKHLPDGLTSVDVISGRQVRFAVDPRDRVVNDIQEIPSSVYLDIYDAKLVSLNPLDDAFVELYLYKNNRRVNRGGKVRCQASKLIVDKIYILASDQVRDFRVQALYNYSEKRYKVVNVLNTDEDIETLNLNRGRPARFTFDKESQEYWGNAFSNMISNGD